MKTSFAESTETYRPDTPIDSTVTIPIEQWKFIKAWAEYGATCDSINSKLVSQIEKDAKRTEKMQNELNQEREKNQKLRNRVMIAGLIAFAEMLTIILLIVI